MTKAIRRAELVLIAVLVLALLLPQLIGPVKLKGVSRQEAYRQAIHLLDTVGLKQTALQYPGELSGDQQRVAIVRAMAMEPRALLFDKPTSALDPTLVGEVLSVIRNLAHQGITMLIVTHELNFAREVNHLSGVV